MGKIVAMHNPVQTISRNHWVKDGPKMAWNGLVCHDLARLVWFAALAMTLALAIALRSCPKVG